MRLEPLPTPARRPRCNAQKHVPITPDGSVAPPVYCERDPGHRGLCEATTRTGEKVRWRR